MTDSTPPSEQGPDAETLRVIGQSTPLGQFSNLPRRIYLTYRYHGIGSVLLRVLTFPLRFTPLGRYVNSDRQTRIRQSRAIAWYRRRGKPVTVLIPSYRDATHVARLVRSIRRTTRRARVRIIVCDDASGEEHLARLRAIRGIEVIAGAHNAGFAANVNRGIRAADPARDVVVLNSDTVARRGWLACLQHAAVTGDRAGVVGAKLLYGDGRIQFAGTVRNRAAPEWFDHRYRFKPADWGPANVSQPVLAVTGACMYIRRELLDQIGGFDEAFPMAYEDVDYCLRAWSAGYRVLYCPEAELGHLESFTRGTEVGERERTSQQVFWERWRDFFDARPVHSSSGALRVVYVTQDTGIGGGHRVIFEHLNQLADRGHEVELWTLTEAPDWFDLRVSVRSFRNYRDLSRALSPVQAIKVATWWETSEAVWEASVHHGIPVYFVQDIEAAYYRDSETARSKVMASYRNEFRYLTTSSWNAEQLDRLGLDAELISPGIDLERFKPLSDTPRRTDMLLGVGRSNPLKNFPLTLRAWRALPEPRPELCLFGIEPELVHDVGGTRYVTGPSDTEVNRLLNEATAFIQTSDHEGFCLPILEAMATGCPVICTDAHGNRDFCEHDRNCLMVAADTESVRSAVVRVLEDSGLRERLGQAGLATAAEYAWSGRIDALVHFLEEIARPRRVEPSTDAVPQLRRSPAG
jgi:GT2 family glycosyltransferase